METRLAHEAPAYIGTLQRYKRVYSGGMVYAHEQDSYDISLECWFSVVLSGGSQHTAVGTRWGTYVCNQTALHYVSGLEFSVDGTTYTKVTRLAARAQAPATMTIARANRAPVPPDKSIGPTSCSRLPAAMTEAARQ